MQSISTETTFSQDIGDRGTNWLVPARPRLRGCGTVCTIFILGAFEMLR